MMADKMATRKAYGETLVELGAENPDLVVMDADLSKSTMTAEFGKKYPERFFNMGIAEQNLYGAAAGLALSGKVVCASTFAMFAAGRAFEIIRNSIGYTRANVKICATHSGITVGEDGASHQSVEDIAIMRSIPNMKVFQPCDARETEQIIKAVADIEGPCYVRLGRLGVEDVYDDSYTWEYGKGQVLKKGSKIAIIATGLMVQESLKAIEQLEDIEPTLINISTIKPIDEELILETAKTHDVIVTIEEHNMIGGLGGAVAETLAPYGLPCRQYMMGMQDSFGRSGKPKDLLAYYHLDASSIAQKIKEIMK